MKTLIKFTFMFIFPLAISACGNLKVIGEKQGDLKELVQAVQVAIEEVSQEKVWENLSLPYQAWNAKCKNRTVKTEERQADLFKYAGLLSDATCSGSGCDDYYTFLAEGKYLKDSVDKNETCLLGKTQEEKDWCKAATQFNNSLAIQNSTCKLAQSLSVPELKKATLSLNVKKGSASGIGLDLVVVSTGFSRSREDSKTMTIELTPISAHAKSIYCKEEGKNQDCELPEDFKLNRISLSPAARDLGKVIKEIILSVVQSNSLIDRSKKDFSNNRGAAVVRIGELPHADIDEKNSIEAPMVPSSFKIELQVVITKEGHFKVGQNLVDGLGVSIGTGVSSSQTNSITIEYSI